MSSTTGRPIQTRIAFILLWLFVFTIPMTQATEIPMIGTISRVAGLAALVAGAVAMAARRQIRLLGPVHIALAGFILWSAVTLGWSVAPDLTVQRIGTYLQLFVLVVLVWELCTEETQILRVMSAFVLGTIIPALATLNAFLPGQQTLLQRASVDGFDPNQLPFLLALSLPASFYLILREKGPVVSLYRLQMGFAVCATLLTGSASAMVAMAVGLSLVCWTFHTVAPRIRTSAFVIVMILIGTAALAVPSKVWQGITEQAGKGEITVTTVVSKGLESVRSTPIGGLGAGTQAHASSAPANSITMLAETGVIGVICFLAVFGVLVLKAERMSGITKSFWLTSLAVSAVGALSLNWDCSQPAWLVFGLLAAHAACENAKGVTEEERLQKRKYYIKGRAEVWS